MPAFFVPLVDPDRQEDAYHELAQLTSTRPHPIGKRIYSITWKHDGVEWTATVGETIYGTETKKIGRGRTAAYREVPRSTDDTVMAIFSSVTYIVAHDNKSRHWNMPIYTGEPSRVVFFEC